MYLNHSVWLIDGEEYVRAAGVVLAGNAVVLQRKGDVMDVGHVQGDLHTKQGVRGSCVGYGINA